MKKSNLLLTTTVVCTLMSHLQSTNCYAQAGSLDLTFGTAGKVITNFGSGNAEGHSTVIQSDGKIIVGGSYNTGSGLDYALARYNSDGSLDNSFGTAGKTTIDFATTADWGYSVALQSDGKIVMAGYSGWNFGLIRVNSDGTPDNSFDGDGKLTTNLGGPYSFAYSTAIQSDGKIVAGGKHYDGTTFSFGLARYNTDGSLDNSFDGDGKLITPLGTGDANGYSIAIQSNGKIIMAGYRYGGTNNDFALARYNTDGSLDNTFGSSGLAIFDFGSSADEKGYSVALQSDGKILVSGVSYTGGAWNSALARYNTNGTLDNTFGAGGVALTYTGGYNQFGNSVSVQPDGKILVGGVSGSGNQNFGLIRYTANGTLDNGFGSGGTLSTPIGNGTDIGFASALQSDGRMLVAGYSDNGSQTDFAVVRYNDCSNPPTVNANATATTLCAGTAVTLTGSGNALSYTWSGGVSDGVGFVPTITKTYTVSGADINGCVSKATITVNVNQLPTVASSSTPASSVCVGSSVTLSGSGTAISYVWTGGVTNGIGFIPTSTSTYTVTGTDANNCSSTSTITITVNPLPTVSVSTTASTLCVGTSITLTGSGAASYSWSTSQTGTAIIQSPVANITYTVIGTDGNGCSGTASIGITANSLPAIGAGPGVAVCTGNSTTLTASGGMSYIWSAGAQTTTSIVVAPTTTSTYTVTGTGANGCSNTGMATVIVNPNPVVTVATTATTVCLGTTLTITGTGASAYMWLPSSITGTSIVVTPTANSTYSVIGTHLNCSDTSMISITINALPNANIGVDSMWVCDGEVLTFSLSSTAGIATYSIMTAFQSSNNNPLTFTYNHLLPPAIVQSNVTGTNGCTATDVIHLVDNTIVNLFQGLPTNNDPSFTFNAASLPSAVDNWIWNFGDGASQVGGMTAPHTYSANGTYTVCLVAMNECDTVSDCSFAVTVVQAGVEEYLLNQNVNIYPVPNNGSFSVKNTSVNSVEVVLENMIGEKINSRVVSANGETQINSELISGIYLVRITDESGVSVVKKMVVEK